MEKLINDFKICFTKGDTYALAVKFKNITEDLSTACFTVKENPDDEPLIQKALGTGISKIDDRAYKNEKTYKVQIEALDTQFLEHNVQYLYDLQVTIGNVVKTVLSGVFVVNHSVSGVSSATTSALEVTAIDEVETEFATTPATVGLEYESDPVALAKIGNLANLPTQSRSTVAGALTEIWMTGNQNALELSAINRGDLAVKRATLADNAQSAEYAKNTDAINWLAPTDETIEDGNIPLRAKATIVLAVKATGIFPDGYYAYKMVNMSVTLSAGQVIYVPYSNTVLVKGEVRNNPTDTTDASLYFVYSTTNYPYALTLNKTYTIGRGVSVENAKNADIATRAITADNATTAGKLDLLNGAKVYRDSVTNGRVAQSESAMSELSGGVYLVSLITQESNDNVEYIMSGVLFVSLGNQHCVASLGIGRTLSVTNRGIWIYGVGDNHLTNSSINGALTLTRIS